MENAIVKILHLMKSTLKYTGALLIFFGIMTAILAGGSEDLEMIKSAATIAVLFVIAGLPCIMLTGLVSYFLYEWEDEE